jgi:hypothetical protein
MEERVYLEAYSMPKGKGKSAKYLKGAGPRPGDTVNVMETGIPLALVARVEAGPIEKRSKKKPATKNLKSTFLSKTPPHAAPQMGAPGKMRHRGQTLHWRRKLDTWYRLPGRPVAD